jgi:predicted type IV restriction endonuclease
MELEARLSDLSKTVREHREVLATEEAAKTALVMPFLQALGYNVFNPAEVVPEFTCDVGIKKGEKVDYAICDGGKVRMLVECKPASTELNISHASQLFRYFATTDARVAVLTNGVIYKFFSDIDSPNKMDDKPFFTINLSEGMKPADVKTLESFTKHSFDIEKIVHQAGTLKLQSLVYKELVKELESPSEELVKLIASKVQPGRVTPAVRDQFKALITASFASLVRDRVDARLKSALNVSNGDEPAPAPAIAPEEDIVTTEEETAGFNIIRAIAAKLVDPKRIVMRDAKSYCAILLDNNNRKTIARLHFNGQSVRYLGTFEGKDETRHTVIDPVAIYQHDQAILKRIEELNA